MPLSTESSSEDEYHDYSHLDLADALKQEIEDGEYTCLICTGDIDARSKIWSCGVCWRVYDLDCIKDWSTRGLKDKNNIQNGFKTWKCPSCNTAQYDPVTEYTCWCGKMTDPPYNGLMPHSCGQTCNVRLGCVHGCPLMCHPGPHDECAAIGPALRCECGNHRKQLPCIITPYDGWRCNDTCGEMLPCGEHKCKAQCHGGLCGNCEALTEALCYCGKAPKQMIPCFERHGALSETAETKWIGHFSCREQCNEPLACGNHTCEQKCHSRQLNDHQCPKSPVKGEACPCGKNEVRDILGHERESCQEPIPNCTASCGKMMDCGHECHVQCHTGSCPPCHRVVASKCRCGSQLYDSPCGMVQSGHKPKCRKRCTAMMNCRRHRCAQICCEYEPKALERERLRKKKLRSNQILANADEPVERVHQCQEACNKVLNCGKHRCVMTCHAGPCRPCIESSPHDYHCPCGHTTLQAPIRCGSMLPTCKHPCTREPACGHPRVDHPCHSDEEACPKCPTIVEKQCTCGRNTVKGVPCHITQVSCGKICGEPLKCGHKCQKVCHKPGDCETVCKSQCGAMLECGHIHKSPCHYDKPCDLVKTCKEMVTLQCKCGHIQRKEQCTQKETGTLECDESCAIAERNRQLAEALNIDTSRKDEQHHEYNSDLLDVYHTDPAWSDGIEEQLIQFVKNFEAKTGKSVLKFPPMRSRRRMFIHMLCEEFGLTSMAQDPEPHRSVTVMDPQRAKIPGARLRKYYNPW